MMRYRLRTLLILMAILPPLIAAVWFVFSARPIGYTTLSGGQRIVIRTSLLNGVGITDNGTCATLNFGKQTAYLDANQFEVIGGRTVQLPASWKTAEVIKSGSDVRIVIDGTPLK